MGDDVRALSEREKQALRFLLGGYDAKSIANELGLSVHTVNERLRHARRKLGVSNSREAARLLANAEQISPNSFGDKGLGVPAAGDTVRNIEPSNQRRGVGHSLAWLGGGMLIMSLIIAAAILASASHTSVEAQPQAPAPATAVSANLAGEAESSARKWVALIDRQAWANSWTAAGALFKSQLSQAQWGSTITNVRQPLGDVSSRVVQGVTRTTSLPNAAPGDYAIIQYRTDFAHRPAATETSSPAKAQAGKSTDISFASGGSLPA